MSNMNFGLLAPALLVLYGMLTVLLVEILTPGDTRPRARDLPPVLALLSLAFTLGAIFVRWPGATGAEGFSGMITADRFALFGQGVIALAGVLGVLTAWNYLRTVGEDHSEFYALLLSAVFGAMIMVGAADLVMVFLGLEILSISAYVLAGFLRLRTESGESALKYFFLGAFSTGFLLYGIALVFGATGSTHLTTIATKIDGESAMLLVGLALILVGFGFKIAAFPFHVWTPDVYQGAPSPVAGFMAAAVKTASFVTMLRVLMVAFGDLIGEWGFILYYLAIATMVFGNFGALVQNHLKRLLAYSSIAHAGYLLVGVSAVMRCPSEGLGAVLFYLLAYTLMTVGAFAVVGHLSRREADADHLDTYRGLAKRHPWLAGGLTIYLMSMAGLPPLIGFVGKFALFAAAVKAELVQLAVVGILTSAVSVYYYIRVVYIMYMTEPEADAPVAVGQPQDWPGKAALIVTAVLVVLLGIVPGPWLAWARASARFLLGE
ncbi:MAG: NADH-quinone oxidoreductase subunit N [Candidatus Lernaella stagnicola]|nr:NADH-quinone oxidoreductase subunit N [Candidatus Lernaella stagnicola]